MPLVDSLLGAIVRLNGNALVMHVGEKPYVVTGSTSLDAYRGPLIWGQVELATKRLTLEAVAGMVRQLLPPDEQQALSDFGAIEYHLAPDPKVPGRFSVIAARGGDDIWLEIRYHRPAVPQTGPEPAAEAAQAAEPQPPPAPMQEAAPPAAADESPAEPLAADMTPGAFGVGIDAETGEHLELGSVRFQPDTILSEGAPTPESVPTDVEESTIEEVAEDVAVGPTAVPEEIAVEPSAAPEEVAIELETAEAAGIGPVAIEPEVSEASETTPATVEPSAEAVAVEPAAEEVAVEPAAPEVVAIEPVLAEAAGIEPVEPVWIEPEVAAMAPAAVEAPVEVIAVEPTAEEVAVETTVQEAVPVEPAVEEMAVEPAVEEAVEREPVAIEAVVAETVSGEGAPIEPPPPTPLAEPARIGPEAAAPTPAAVGPMVPRIPLDRLLRLAAARGASALYIVAQSPPAIRVDGEIALLESEGLLASGDVAAMLMQPAPMAPREAPQQGVEGEWVADVPGVGRVRCLSFRDHRGPGGIFRMLPARALSVEQLGLSRAIQELSAESEGLVLVTGPRASGKQTLVSAFVDLVNRTRADHVITLESQILFVHESRRSFVSQRELSGTGQELADAARAALRENPDVLVIDDLRSPELTSVALQAAELGLLVIAALPAPGTRAAIERMVDQFAPERRAQVQTTLAGALRGIVAQVLVRKIGGGRLAAREVLLNTRSVAGFIAEGRTSEIPLAIEGGRRLGMVPLNDALIDAVRSGAVDAAEAYRRTCDHDGLLAGLRREGIDTAFVERFA